MDHQLPLPGLAPDPDPLTPDQTHPDGGRLPAWITEQLEHNRPGTGSTTAKFHRCHLCYQIVLTGLDGDTLGITSTVDPTPLDSTLEYALTLMDRSTYHATPTPTGYRLAWRLPAHRIPDQPVIGHVLPAHLCGHRLPGFITDPVPDPDPYHDPGAPPF